MADKDVRCRPDSSKFSDRNRFPDPYTGASGDATFPNYIVLASYGYRFGSTSGRKTDTAICPINREEKP